MANSYYSIETHGYLQYANDRLANYVYSLLPLGYLQAYDSAIEFGAGMGRFSAPIVKQFKTVTLVEPEPSYAKTLREKFTQPHVSIVESSAGDYLSKGAMRSSAIFAFHLMHHVSASARAEIFAATRSSRSVGVLVEPNPINPLILVQVLCHPDMKFSEEKQYLRLTKNSYKKELAAAGLRLFTYKHLLFLPPFVTNSLLQRCDPAKISWLEKLIPIFPFLGSYQVMVYGSDDR